MTYKEIVLRLLNSRDGLICIEDHLISDFREFENPYRNFLKWCVENSIAFQRIEDKAPKKLHLKKALHNLHQEAIPLE